MLHRFGHGLLVILVACLGLMPARAEALPIDLGTLSSGDFDINGAFAFDNDVALFSFFLASDAVLSLEFTSLLELPPTEELLGFDATVTFFGPGSQFVDGFLGNLQFDASLGVPSPLSLTLAPGDYVLAVSQYDNLYFPEAGFQYAGIENQNYTATLYDPVPGCDMFLGPSGCRTGRFDATLTIEAENVQPVPEPGTLALVMAGGAALLARRRRWKRSGSSDVTEP